MRLVCAVELVGCTEFLLVARMKAPLVHACSREGKIVMSQCRRVDVAKNSCSLVTFYSISLSFFFFPERPLIRRPMHSSVKSRRSSGPGTLCDTAEEVWVGFFFSWRSRRLAFEHECFAVRYIPSATKRVSSPKAGRPCSCFYHIKHPLPFCIFASKHAPNSIMPLPFVPPIVTERVA